MRSEVKPTEIEGLFQALAERSPVGVYIVQDRRFCYVNPCFQQFTGYSEHELLDEDPLELVIAEDREMVRENAVRMLKGGPSAPYRFRATCKDGSTRWVMESVSSIQYRGRPATLGTYMDITEQKRQNERLIMTDRLASIGELASGTAHELNNPLTSIAGFSELLMEKDVPDEVREDLRLIYTEAQRAAVIVKNLLTFARKHPPVKRLNQINKIIEDALKLRAYERKANGIVVKKQLAPDLPEILVDGFQMQQVFLNIILNAEYAMTESNNGGALTITTVRRNGAVVVSVADDGPGIRPEHLGQLFNPFFTTKEVGKGTGLGLSICHGIVSEHGGQIYVRSEPDKGATFFIELPLNGCKDPGLCYERD